MTTVNSTICSHAWNIEINDYPPASRCLAGAFQYIDNLFLTWKKLFQDLQLCFNLELYIAAPEARLALYLLNIDHVLVEKLETPFVYYSGLEEQLTKFIKLKALNGPENPDLLNTCLNVCIISYNATDCKEAESKLANHFQSGILGCHQ